MSATSMRKPTSREELISLLLETGRRDAQTRSLLRGKPTKPTVTGTAKLLKVHRDTLYAWLKQFRVDFSEIANTVLATQSMEDVGFRNQKHAYLIGEALVGEGDEVAHVDLLMGDKDGPVGKAFAAGISSLSAGHTPLLAVIRPNLPPKPHTLLVPKVTVKNLEDAGRIFGPAQAAVAKAVADAVEEGIVPKDKIDDWVIVCSVFIHPKAKDFRRIYHYNYGAVKLALKRALADYPPLEKILYDKDRARHPIMGFKVPRLWRPPYIQISLDIPDLKRSKRIIEAIPKSDRVIFEIGTPLIKKYGTKIISELREKAEDVFFVADLKTLDVGKVEVDLAYDETADAVVAAGLAPMETLNAFTHEARRLGIYAVVDMLNVEDPIQKMKSLKYLPDIVVLHRGIDQETGGTLGLGMIRQLRQAFAEKRFLIAVAGGIVPETAKEALEKGADILVVGRYITQSRDIERSVRELLDLTPEMGRDVDLFRTHTE